MHGQQNIKLNNEICLSEDVDVQFLNSFWSLSLGFEASIL
jgi:hypothetical protein